MRISTQPTPSNEWYTPEWLISDVKRVIHGLALDPASCEKANFMHGFERFYVKEEDGLSLPWNMPWFCNPPYSAQGGVEPWIRKAADSPCSGVMLLNASTERRWFRILWYSCPALCFLYKRIRFISGETMEPGGDPRYASVLALFSEQLVEVLNFSRVMSDHGQVVMRTAPGGWGMSRSPEMASRPKNSGPKGAVEQDEPA